jgi:hypothetical protein
MGKRGRISGTNPGEHSSSLNPLYRIHSAQRITLSFNQEKYHLRNKVETVFSVMKRKFGESLKARKYRLQIKKITIKVILCNLSRTISTFLFLIFIEEFYRAE